MPNYSHSKLACFEDCPKKYDFRYVQRVVLPEAKESVEAFLGKRVHESLEWLYTQVKMARVPTRTELLEYYRGEWAKNWNPNVAIVRTEFTQDDYARIGEKCLLGYYNSHAPFDAEKTISLESPISISLGEYNIRGYIDRLSTKDGVFEIHDY